MEVRKLIEFGKSSNVVSIPKAWVREHKLQKGDRISITETEEGLLLYPQGTEKQTERKTVVINTKGRSLKGIKNRIISHYIRNYNDIIVEGPNVKENLAEIREIIHHLIALEVMEESETRVAAKDFLNMRDISLNDLLNKMDMITKEMISDSKKTKNKDLPENIAARDQGVNRLCYLVYRTIRYLQQNPAMAKKKGYTSEQLSDAWIVATGIEQISDQVKRIAKLISCIKGLDKEGMKELMQLYTEAGELYNTSITTYMERDTKKAYALARTKSELIEKLRKYQDKQKNNTCLPQVIEKLKFMVGFTQPICKTVTT